MKASTAAEIEAPRKENGRPLHIAGLRERFTGEPWKGTPELWQKFAPHLGKIPGQVGNSAYGLCFLLPDGVEYLAGVEVSGSPGLPAGFATATIPGGKFLVFAHREHVSRLHVTCERIHGWLTTSGYEAAKATGAPDFFERYTEEFDPRTGMGGMEIWVPIRE